MDYNMTVLKVAVAYFRTLIICMERKKKATNNESVAQLHDQNYNRVLLKHKVRG